MKSISNRLKGFFYGGKTYKRNINYEIEKINTRKFDEFDNFFLEALEKANFEHAQEMLNKGYEINKEITTAIENTVFLFFLTSFSEDMRNRDMYDSEYVFHPIFKDYVPVRFNHQEDMLYLKNIALNWCHKQTIPFLKFVYNNNLLSYRVLMMLMENPSHWLKGVNKDDFPHNPDKKEKKEIEENFLWRQTLQAFCVRGSFSKVGLNKNGDVKVEEYMFFRSIFLSILKNSELKNININKAIFKDLECINTYESGELDMWQNPYLIQTMLEPHFFALIKGNEYEQKLESYWNELSKEKKTSSIIKLEKDTLYFLKLKLLISFVKNCVNNKIFTPQELFEKALSAFSLNSKKIEIMNQWSLFILVMYPEEIVPLLNQKNIKIMLQSKEMSERNSDDVALFPLLENFLNNEAELIRKNLMKRLEIQVSKKKMVKNNTIESLIAEYGLDETVISQIKKIEAAIQDLNNKTLQDEEKKYIQNVNEEIFKMIENIQGLKEIDKNINYENTLISSLSLVIKKLQEMQRRVLTEQLNDLNQQNYSAQVITK